MSTLRLNITVDPAVIERARRYTQQHNTTISRLVTGFLAQPPVEDDSEGPLTPTVQRLLGVAEGERDREDYRRHLVEKYGR
jgi:hypothetical protein